MSLVLAGDVGGTKTRLSLVDSALNFKVIALKEYPSRDFKSFGAVISTFREAFPHEPGPIGIGAAGPVVGQRIDVTNLPWVIAADDLKLLGYKLPVLLNDMMAFGAGIELLDSNGIKTLNQGIERPGNRAVIAAGTGLGECFLVKGHDQHWIACASEGGHTDFSPTSDTEIELLKFMRTRHQRVSWERILSGKFGFRNIADFLALSGNYPEAILPNDDIKSSKVDLGPILSARAQEGDRLSQDALRFFARLYGSEAGNLALKFLALGGVYIGGGIANKILPWLKGPEFMEGFTAKGRFSSLVAEVPVHVIADSDCAIKGAALMAARAHKA